MGSVAGIFPIGDTGESFLVAEWIPDPKVIQAQLMKFAVDSEIMAEPLAAAREAFIYDTSLHFETESDPYGRAWTPLEDAYLRRKTREGVEGNILHASGDLEQAATSAGPWMITERDILFDLEKIPFYGPYHQAGTMDEMQQQIASKTRAARSITGALPESLLLTPEEAGYSTPDTSRGHNLPQRMFIGADEDTIAEIEEIFLKWLDGLIRKDWTGGMDEPVPVMGSNVLGTFPIMSFTPTGQPRLSTGQFGRKL